MHGRSIVTQVGSLPFDDVGVAIDYSSRHDIPFLPELPKMGDAVLSYITKPGTLSCLTAFKDMASRNGYPVVKVQCVGPATLISSGYSEDEAVSRPLDHITAILDGLYPEQVILVLDEPALGNFGGDYKSMWSAMFAAARAMRPQIIPGIHTCGNMDWDQLLLNPGIEVISHDASKNDIIKASTVYRQGRQNGKRIAWGITIPSDVKDFRQGDLLTLPCGMGSYDPQSCEGYLTMLTAAAEQLST
ncbi:hypothetical protein A3K63_02200 [Candidatus Micrarchaeota archaeon RBG_16_49_10]|nr:MAG: hypothetical protein A3K63_02200 [Candidatus Micrarchaeota archaeon RBG_16_49_10]